MLDGTLDPKVSGTRAARLTRHDLDRLKTSTVAHRRRDRATQRGNAGSDRGQTPARSLARSQAPRRRLGT